MLEYVCESRALEPPDQVRRQGACGCARPLPAVARWRVLGVPESKGRMVNSAVTDSVGHVRLARCRDSLTTRIRRMIEQGDQAPNFELPDQDGHAVNLSDFRGRPVVVYFYPKASTPGCTTQACGVRDRQADYEEAGAVVLGISPDPVARVKKFHENEGLNFALLADEDHSVTERYDVWSRKSMYGKTYMGAERTTFIIDSAGKVAEVLRKVKPAEHDELVLEALERAAPPTL